MLWWENILSLKNTVKYTSCTNYKIVKVGGFAFGVRVNAINSSTQTKLDNRRGINIDVTKLTSVGGYSIVDYPDLLKRFRFGEINAYKTAE